MPEGPELHLASKFVTANCAGRIFGGKIVKNPVHKSYDVEFDSSAYSIGAVSRGKEMMLILTDDASKNGASSKTDKKPGNDDKEQIKGKEKLTVPKFMKILFRFGMSGNFQFTTPDTIHKHAHLKFYTADDKPSMVLSYVDVRRFGRWEVDVDWSKERGPDPMFEYRDFRSNVVNSLSDAAFNHPICETLLNQKYFNGIGNYLRAEILYRLQIPPFEKARTVLEGLNEEPPDVKPMKGGKGAVRNGGGGDLLHLCHTVPLEVISIGAGGYTADGKASDYSDFMKWLRCYYQDGMKTLVDHNKRTIWFSGPPGPMVPKDEKSRKPRSPKKRKQEKGAGDEESSEKVKKESLLPYHNPSEVKKAKEESPTAAGDAKKGKKSKGAPKTAARATAKKSAASKTPKTSSKKPAAKQLLSSKSKKKKTTTQPAAKKNDVGATDETGDGKTKRAPARSSKRAKKSVLDNQNCVQETVDDRRKASRGRAARAAAPVTPGRKGKTKAAPRGNGRRQGSRRVSKK
ncbi:endonuclease 8-like 1 [Diadema antillarum]|uniref:endonuclease 8-like 1 n=1 Tax=Diadema antillarum TaxID=105358 RepID=UPI003A87F961